MGDGPRILQVHPTLACNLRCAHCYSESGPQHHAQIPAGELERAVADARELGYDVLSVSGGEPFVYRDLGRLLAYARSLGMRTTVTSNGTLLEKRLERVAGELDGLALSLDGPPELHNELRASPTAFERLERGIEVVQETGIPFGFIYTVTGRSWASIPWAAGFAVERGATLLQLHPLELVGRADGTLDEQVLDRGALARTYLLSRAIEAEYGASLTVQLDLVLRSDVVADPELIYAGPAPEALERPADALRNLVIEADGTVVPLVHGFGRHFAIGNVFDEPLATAWERWWPEGYPAFRQLCATVHATVVESSARLISWHERAVAESRLTRSVSSG